jgi:hypothetical protein
MASTHQVSFGPRQFLLTIVQVREQLVDARDYAALGVERGKRNLEAGELFCVQPGTVACNGVAGELDELATMQTVGKELRVETLIRAQH